MQAKLTIPYKRDIIETSLVFSYSLKKSVDANVVCNRIDQPGWRLLGASAHRYLDLLSLPSMHFDGYNAWISADMIASCRNKCLSDCNMITLLMQRRYRCLDSMDIPSLPLHGTHKQPCWLAKAGTRVSLHSRANFIHMADLTYSLPVYNNMHNLNACLVRCVRRESTLSKQACL